MRRALLLAGMCAGCTEAESAPRTSATSEGVVAEVHLHQYASGSHAAAGFVRTRVPYRHELDEVLVHFAREATLREGDCRLDLSPQCAPSCDGRAEYCEQAQCRSYTPLVFEDGGPVKISGSAVASPIELTFDARIPAYRSGRASSAPLFEAGDRLAIEVPSGPWAFRTEVVAPKRPEPLTPLTLTTAAPLRVAWSGNGASIAVRIDVAGGNTSGSIICVRDEDPGELTVPQALLSRLPPPPRSVTWSIERFERRRLSLRPGELAIVTVAATHVLEIDE